MTRLLPLFAALVSCLLCVAALAQQPPPQRGGVVGGRTKPNRGLTSSELTSRGLGAGSHPAGGPGSRRRVRTNMVRAAAPRRPGSAVDPRGMGRGQSLAPGRAPGMAPRELDRLEQDDPQMHKLLVEDIRLEQASLDLARQFRAAKPADREKLRAALEVEVNKHFEVRQQRRELQLRRMEEELKRLREAIVSQRFAERHRREATVGARRHLDRSGVLSGRSSPEQANFAWTYIRKAVVR